MGGHLRKVETSEGGVTWGVGADNTPWAYTGGWGGSVLGGKSTLVKKSIIINFMVNACSYVVGEVVFSMTVDVIEEITEWLCPHRFNSNLCFNFNKTESLSEEICNQRVNQLMSTFVELVRDKFYGSFQSTET